MTKKLWKDFFVEIRKTLPRYLSILFIVALGVAFFSGVRASEPDMRLSADAYYDDMNFMDIRVISTLGLTDDDLEAIRTVEGVTEAEGLYSVDAFLETDEKSLVATVQSMTGDVNRYHLSEGRLPEAANECLLDEAFLMRGSYAIGDTIRLRSGTSDPLTDSLKAEEYTIVGFGLSPMFLSWDRGSATIGNGDVTGFVVLTPEAFLTDVYTQIFVTANQADGLMAMTEEYDAVIDPVQDAIEAISEERCDIRYHELTDEPYRELADAKQKLEDGRQELEDARQQLADALTQLEDGEEQIADARLKIREGEIEIQVNERTLRQAEADLAAGQAEYAAGEAEYEANVQKIADAESQLTEGKITYRLNEQKLNDAKEQLEAVKKQIQENEESYQNALARVNSLGNPETDAIYGRELLKGYADKLLSDTTSLLSWQLYVEQLYNGGGEGAVISEETYNSLMALTTEEVAGLMFSYATVTAYEEALALLEPLEQQIADGEKQLTEGKAQIDEAERQLNDGRAQLEEGSRELVKASVQLEIAQQQITEGNAQLKEAKQQLKEGKAELEEKEQELKDGWTEYYRELPEAEQKIADGEAELKQAEEDIAKAERELRLLEDPQWYVLDRNGVQAYVEYNSDADRIGAVGEVFPVIFFLVAALVSLTTMTRMVEEQRTLIGTMKALGYGKGAIAAKYILYALSASLIGSLIGVAVGEYLLPQIILQAYGMLYLNLPYRLTPPNLYYGLLSTGIAVLCTTAATMFACFRELMSGPAILMRPVAPKQGKRVFLERIPFIWKRLTFTSKATVRNLFRYKKRFFMTIFGIGGCMALLMVGFGLRDSIQAIIKNQYRNIWVYDAYATVDDNADQEERDSLKTSVEAIPGVRNALEIRQIATDVEANGVTKSITLFVPQSTEGLEDFIILKDRIGDEHYELDDSGVIINEKLASMLELSAGDIITLKDGDTRRYTAVVSAVSENYLNNFLYMTSGVYEELYGTEPVYNNLFMNLDEEAALTEEELSGRLLEMENVTGVTLVSNLHAQVENMMRSLDLVVWVLIVAAGLLAYVVLYNLNNINITERRRELATLKVLGFYNLEVAEYVYRENVLLTVFGVLFGAVFGFLLHRYMILTLEVDMIMFGRAIQPLSYVLSILITFFFAILVNLIMYYSLKKIDMVESLKSVE